MAKVAIHVQEAQWTKKNSLLIKLHLDGENQTENGAEAHDPGTRSTINERLKLSSLRKMRFLYYLIANYVLLISFIYVFFYSSDYFILIIFIKHNYNSTLFAVFSCCRRMAKYRALSMRRYLVAIFFCFLWIIVKHVHVKSVLWSSILKDFGTREVKMLVNTETTKDASYKGVKLNKYKCQVIWCSSV